MEDIKVFLAEGNNKELRFTAFDENEGLLGEMSVSILPEHFLIDGIYVLEKHRRQGVATELVDYFLDTMPEQIIMPVRCSIDMGEEEGKELYAFFEQRDDFILSQGIPRYLIPVKGLTETIFKDKKNQTTKKYKTSKLSELSDAEEKKLKEILAEYELYDFTVMNKLEDCCDVNFSMAVFNEDVSAVIVDMPEDGKCEVITFIGTDNVSALPGLLFDTCYNICKKDDSLKLDVVVYDENILKQMDVLYKQNKADKKEIVIASWTMSQAYNLM